MENFCLKWNEFDTNIRDYFKKLREDQRLFDVTLATDDGQHIQAHKMILSAASSFFSDLFMKSNHTNMLIYLKGISSAQLENVTDFIYNGEAFIAQEELKIFLDTAKELQINGLQGELQGIGQSVPNDIRIYQDSEIKTEKSNNKSRQQDSLNNLSDPYLVKDDTSVTLKTNDQINFQVEEMIEGFAGGSRCKVCGKTADTKQVIRRHAETHIEGVSHDCSICSKTFSIRRNLKQHIYNIHSELLSCDVCGKSEMNRKAHYKHKMKCN